MKFENIIIKRKEGVKFAQQSGDKNKIHLDYITGYNSQFGENIVHGSYLLIKFLTLIELMILVLLRSNSSAGSFMMHQL